MNHGWPRQQQSHNDNMAKISKSYILTPSHPRGMGCQYVKCEQPFHELTVQVWLLYDHPNFKYCTLYRTQLRTDRRTDRKTDDSNTRCPRRTFQARGIKKKLTTGRFITNACIVMIVSSSYCKAFDKFSKHWNRVFSSKTESDLFPLLFVICIGFTAFDGSVYSVFPNF